MNITLLNGNSTEIEGICIMTQNSVNEKIYFFLWFWYMFLVLVGIIQFQLEFTTLTLPSFQYWLITKGRRMTSIRQILQGISWQNEQSNLALLRIWFLIFADILGSMCS